MCDSPCCCYEMLSVYSQWLLWLIRPALWFSSHRRCLPLKNISWRWRLKGGWRDWWHHERCVCYKMALAQVGRIKWLCVSDFGSTAASRFVRCDEPCRLKGRSTADNVCFCLGKETLWPLFSNTRSHRAVWCREQSVTIPNRAALTQMREMNPHRFSSWSWHRHGQIKMNSIVLWVCCIRMACSPSLCVCQSDEWRSLFAVCRVSLI